ncbi:MAG: hypothetical protein HQM13_24190 [SAR324 cluster bacterium]|nr:hypothetical protein [SAR324 cluster bacterium]
MDNLFSEIGAELNKTLELIYSSYPYFVFTTDVFYSNQKTIKLALSNIAFAPRKIDNSQLSKVLWEFKKNDLIRKPSNVEKFNFLQVNHKQKTVSLLTGNWEMSDNLILPENYKFLIGKGTHLHLLNSAKIISYGPIELIGEPEWPIIIDTPDATGQGVAVIQAKAQSEVKHVIFRDLSNPSHLGWQLTGAITFYESSVKLDNVKFTNTRSEDALNIIRSKFSIKYVSFDAIPSDAIDIDFGNGKIMHSSVSGCGNDGIDLSGSRVRIEDVLVQQCKDKALSIGENSSAQIKELRIDDAFIALTSKDLSEVEGENIAIRSAEFGVAIFQKKPEFGPSHVSIRKLKTKNVKTSFLVEHHSTLQVDDFQIEPNQKKVEKFLYPNK